MKLRLFSVVFSALFFCYTAKAQHVYHLPNPSFEYWEGDYTSEPRHWNTFSTSDGTFSGLASANHHFCRDGGCPGSTGNRYLTIYTKSIAGIKANGNMTTGRIHAGAMSAGSSDNYNYTMRGNADFCQPFHGTPDSLYVWVSFYAGSASSVAHVEAIIHGDNDFRAPNDLSSLGKYKGRAVASTTRTTTSNSQMQWMLKKVPFVYDGTSEAAYILVNITTNETPGGGDANDSLSVDDMQFIYSAWLTGIKVNYQALEDFSKGRFSYAIHVEEGFVLDNVAISATPEVNDASVQISREQVNDTLWLARINVTSEDQKTIKEYRLWFTTGDADSFVRISDPQPIPAIKAYPNPAKEWLTVEAEGQVALYDLQGKLLLSWQCHDAERIDISHLASGVYILRNNGNALKIIK